MMLNTEHVRDLVVLGIVFGAAALVWAGWAQEKPPSTPWRFVLAVFSLGGLALLGIGIPAAIRSWDDSSAIEPGSPAFVAYVVWFWLEFVVAGVGAYLLIRRRRRHLVAPFVLVIVGLHFFPLAAVFAQPVLYAVASLLTAVGVSGFFVSRRLATPSFWCGVLAAPIFLAVGAWALVTGLSVAG
jgi:hypothetical protein